MSDRMTDDEIRQLVLENAKLKAMIQQMENANRELFVRFIEYSKELRHYEEASKVRRIEKL